MGKPGWALWLSGEWALGLQLELLWLQPLWLVQ
jgi:hypothetical protein